MEHIAYPTVADTTGDRRNCHRDRTKACAEYAQGRFRLHVSFRLLRIALSMSYLHGFPRRGGIRLQAQPLHRLLVRRPSQSVTPDRKGTRHA